MSRKIIATFRGIHVGKKLIPTKTHIDWLNPAMVDL
jgi:hypothetical protein